MVISDHGSVAHAKIGVDNVNPDIVAARRQVDDQGLEWNIPAAEHGTGFGHPGKNEVAVRKEVENLRRRGEVGHRAGPSADEASGQVSFTYDLGRVDGPCHLRLRGTGGRRSAPGYHGAALDQAGPATGDRRTVRRAGRPDRHPRLGAATMVGRPAHPDRDARSGRPGRPLRGTRCCANH
jgi:hypothetical protein